MDRTLWLSLLLCTAAEAAAIGGTDSNLTSGGLLWSAATEESDLALPDNSDSDGGFSSLDGMLQWAISHSDPTKLKESAQAQQRLSPSELQKRQMEIKEIMEKIKMPSDAELMKIAISDLNNMSVSLEDRYRALQELLELVEPIDNANVSMLSGSSLVALKASRARRGGAGSSSAPTPDAPVIVDCGIVIEEPLDHPDSPTQILQERIRRAIESFVDRGKRVALEGSSEEREDPMPVIARHSDTGPFIDERLLSTEVMKNISEQNVTQTLAKLQTFAVRTAAEARMLDRTILTTDRKMTEKFKVAEEKAARKLSAALKLNEDAQARISDLEKKLADSDSSRKRENSEANRTITTLEARIEKLEKDIEELDLISANIGGEQFQNAVAQIQHFNLLDSGLCWTVA